MFIFNDSKAEFIQNHKRKYFKLYNYVVFHAVSLAFAQNSFIAKPEVYRITATN